MDGESQQASNQLPQPADTLEVVSSSFHRSELPEAQCIVCRRAFTPGTGVNDGLEAISICPECKSLVVDGSEISATIRSSRERRRRRRRARYGSSQSIEDLFSQLIDLVRQNHDIQVDDGDTIVTVHQHAVYSPARSWNRNRRRAVSDNDSESVDHVESIFGESDSNISYYGGDSDASVGGHSLMGREMFTQLDNGSPSHTDTDIDPMHAGLEQWNSDDQWEEVSVQEGSVQRMGLQGNFQENMSSPSGSIGSAQTGTWVRWRVRHAELFAELEESDEPLFFGNSGDYLDSRGFEELLEQLAETEGSRRGAPPAAASVVRNLPSVIISELHEKNGSLICAVCKDPLVINTEAKQLPCLHLYHPSCILPWLNARNSCPVCRYELPTDDLEYEEGKRDIGRNEIREQSQAEESSSDIWSDLEAEDAQNEHSEARLEQAEDAGRARDANSLNREGGRVGRLLLAAAPILSIVGVALALWFQNSWNNGRIGCGIREQDRQQPQRSDNPSSQPNRNRRWWSLF